ncbi:hypothetical protein BDW62DRAFT_200792 [Aspergillus aurantiobrunneus]
MRPDRPSHHRSNTVDQRAILRHRPDHANWATAHYGTTALVDARLDIALYTSMGMSINGNEKIVRLCTSHLGSMALDPPFRPAQMQLIARYMHAQHVTAAVTAGDFNAIQPFDRTLHVDDGNNLKDAFLEWEDRRTARSDIHGGSRPPRRYGSGLGSRAWTRFVSVVGEGAAV